MRSTPWIRSRRDTFRVPVSAEGREGESTLERSSRSWLNSGPGKEYDQTEMTWHADPRHTYQWHYGRMVISQASGSDDLILVLPHTSV